MWCGPQQQGAPALAGSVERAVKAEVKEGWAGESSRRIL